MPLYWITATNNSYESMDINKSIADEIKFS